MNILQTLKNFDKFLFEQINRGLHWQVLDPLMLALRNPLTWIPLYIFMGAWSIVKLKKKAWVFIFFTVATIALTDSIAASVLKPLFERLRPCYEPTLAGMVWVLDGCGGKYSFPSNHAANHIGLAVFWFNAIRITTGQKWYWLGAWAFLICYAQIYVGKHYPGDILGGALLGSLVASFTFRIFVKLLQRMKKKPAFSEQHEAHLDGWNILN